MDFCLGRGDIIVFGEQEESRKLEKPKSSSRINITKLIENTVVCKRGKRLLKLHNPESINFSRPGVDTF